MRRRVLAVAAAFSVLAPLGALVSAGTASAAIGMNATPASYIVRGGSGTATLSARYTCQEGVHLWVSAKQAPGGRFDMRLEQGGSSQISAAWYEAHPTNFTCNGTRQNQTFTITNHEQGFGTLQRGLAYVQFCLVSAEGELLISETRWVAVI